jgi:hypothetical protein
VPVNFKNILSQTPELPYLLMIDPSEKEIVKKNTEEVGIFLKNLKKKDPLVDKNRLIYNILKKIYN